MAKSDRNAVTNLRVDPKLLEKNNKKKYQTIRGRVYFKVMGYIFLAGLILMFARKFINGKFVFPNLKSTVESSEEYGILEEIIAGNNPSLLDEYDEIRKYVLLLKEFEELDISNKDVSLNEYANFQRLSYDKVSGMLLEYKNGDKNDEMEKQLQIQLGLINHYLATAGYEKIIELYSSVVAMKLTTNLGTDLSYSDGIVVEVAKEIAKNPRTLIANKGFGELEPGFIDKTINIDFTDIKGSDFYIELNDDSIGYMEGIYNLYEASSAPSNEYDENDARLRALYSASEGINKCLQERCLAEDYGKTEQGLRWNKDAIRVELNDNTNRKSK